MVLLAQLLVQGLVVMTIFRVASRARNGSVGLCKTLLSHFQMMAVLKARTALQLHCIKTRVFIATTVSALDSEILYDSFQRLLYTSRCGATCGIWTWGGRRQWLTLVHFSAQPEPFLTQITL